MKVGIIGLGLMGSAFSKLLLSKGYDVYGFDVNAGRREVFESWGGHFCDSCAEVGQASDAVILMVFDSNNVRDVVYGKSSLLAAMQEGKSLLITCSVGYAVLEEIASDFAAKSVFLLDTPLMGNCEDAEAGEIHIIVAGDDAAYKANEQLLHDMGKELYFVSKKVGDGQRAKSCLQALFSLTFETAFEVVTLAQCAGLNMDEMHRMFKNSPSSSPLLHISEENVINKVYTGTKNPLSILDKDIKLVLELAEKYGLKLGSCEGTARVFDRAMEKFPKEDIWAAVKALR